MLERIELVNFKSFADQGVDLGPLTLLVGANASGKSNLLDALQFLNGIGLNMTLPEVVRGKWESGREIWPGVRGGGPGIARAGTSSFTLRTRLRAKERDPFLGDNVAIEFDVRDSLLLHELSCRAAGQPSVVTERLRCSSSDSPDDINFDVETVFPNGSGVQEVDLQVRSPEQARYTLRMLADRSFVTAPSGLPYELSFRTSLMEEVIRSTSFDPLPRVMRDYVPRQQQQLGAEGENISAVLWQLCQDENRRKDLTEWLSALCAPELSDIDFVETELGDVMLVLVEKDGTRTPARSLSDGTLRFLGLLVALMTIPEGSRVLLEEIETGLHPMRIHLLVEFLEEVTRTRNVQVIATTHSPLVLQALSEGSLKNAIVFGRTPEVEGTVMRRLQDLPHFDELLQRRGIEHLFTTGWLERSL